jgi:hypothetical protein
LRREPAATSLVAPNFVGLSHELRVHDNIDVKTGNDYCPVAPAPHYLNVERASCLGARLGSRAVACIATHNEGLINRFTARQYCALACDLASDDNCFNRQICLAELTERAPLSPEP